MISEKELKNYEEAIRKQKKVEQVYEIIERKNLYDVFPNYDHSFNHIILNEEEDIEVYMVNSTNLERNLILEQKLGRSKFVRPYLTRMEHLLNSDVWDD